MHGITVSIARFGVYPADEPNSYVVGFNVTHVSGRTIYRDVLVPFDTLPSGHSDTDATDAGWAALESGILAWAGTCSPRGLVGSVFVPPGVVPSGTLLPIAEGVEEPVAAEGVAEGAAEGAAEVVPSGTLLPIAEVVDEVVEEPVAAEGVAEEPPVVEPDAAS